MSTQRVPRAGTPLGLQPVAGRRSKERGRVEGMQHGDVADVDVLRWGGRSPHSAASPKPLACLGASQLL